MADFKVRVTRYFEDEGYPSYFGVYVSKVYAANSETSEFLVYDPGDYNVCEGFTWVSFLETMIPIDRKNSDIDRVPIVTLVEEEEKE